MAPESAALTEVRQRVAVLEVGHKQLIDQMADVAVRNEALDREITTMRDDIREAVKEGMQEAIGAFFESAQKRAAEKTGMWLWGAVKGFFSRWFVIGAIILTVGKYAGWSVASTVFDAITGARK